MYVIAHIISCSSVINSKAEKAAPRHSGKLFQAAALPNFSDTLTLSQSDGLGPTIGQASPKFFRGYARVDITI